MAPSSTTGTRQDIDESRAEALQALLNSISPTDARAPGQKLSSDQVKRISDRLGELLGDSNFGTQKRNEKGELLNEEGLPIIDIVEPVKDNHVAVVTGPTPIFDDPDVLPLWALSPAEKARRKAERERILDLLEVQELIEQEREEAAERERWRADLERRKEAAKAELENLRRAKELQMKMGKALLRNVVETQEKVEREKQAEAHEKQAGSKPKKSVSFADGPGSSKIDEEKPEDGEDQWGDVSLARLRKGKTSLLTRAQMERQPMKMDVVERHPGGAPREPPLQSHGPDSDDESVPGSLVPADSDEGEVISSDVCEDEETPSQLPLSDSDLTEAEQMSNDGEPVTWQDDEFDFAQHQREIALAYYEKRATIGMEVYGAMRAHSHEEDAHEWDYPEVPLEATLASAHPKPAVSRFKIEHATAKSTSTLASHSLGPSVLSSSHSSGIKKAMRMGKVENGQLVGDESDDDTTQEAREIIELLSRGEVTNIGPQPVAGPSTMVHAVSSPMPLTFSGADASKNANTTCDTSVPLKPRRKVSRFRLALQPSSQAQTLPLLPNAETPRMISDRSSPKLTSPAPGTPVSAPSSTSRLSERRHNQGEGVSVVPESVRRNVVEGQMPSTIVESPSFRPPLASTRMPSMVVESPSFRSQSSATSGPTTLVPQVATMPSMIVDSPSFLPPESTSTVVGSPSFQSFIIESPTSQLSDSKQKGPAVAPRSMSAPVSPAAANASRSTVNGHRQGLVMAAEVKEATPAPRRGDAGGGVKERKVSKFMAERM